MPAIRYQEPIEFHVNKNAYLQWDIGKQYVSTVPTQTNRQGGIIEVLVASAIDSHLRAKNPSQYEHSYGKAQQAIFMTSLKDTLAENHVFNAVELSTEPHQITPKEVLINIYFKNARVADGYHNYKITLSVVLTITTHGKAPFTRTFLVENEDEGNKTFIDQQTDVSQKLMEKIIGGIKTWHTNKN